MSVLDTCLDPQFVSSFDVDEFVYFFFRELSLEHANCGHVVYSRVARVCKVRVSGYAQTKSVTILPSNLRHADHTRMRIFS